MSDEPKVPEEKVTLQLDPTEVCLLLEALDSHRYWGLSDPNYRDSGFVHDPGSDDPEKADAIRAVDELEARLEGLR